MTYRTLIERTVYIAKCEQCDETVVCDTNPPRQRMCNGCKQWITFVKQTAVGPDFTGYAHRR